MDLVEHIVREDFFLDEVSKEDLHHMERLMTECGVVDTSTFPRHVLELFCVVCVEHVYFYCYRTLVQSLGVKVVPRDVVLGPVHTQSDLMQCLNVKNIIDHIY